MIDKKIIAEYNKTRNVLIDKTICHAPFTSINFEQSGSATACCYNRSHILGTYPKDTIREMWFGEKADELRAYILNNDLGGGCQLCLKQLYSHNFSNCKAKGYDFYADSVVKSYFQKAVYGKKRVDYPRVMEFELSNTCNLECIMCSGHFSSSIRKNREHKSPLANSYNSEFVKQLEEFVPHLKEARFLGGEPFLIDIYYEIWVMILRVNPQLKISITTNGSVLNNRTKELLNKLNCGIIISVDSIVKETYEKIRINAKHENLMRNFEWLYNYSQTKKMGMSFAVCPMTENCLEMPELVEFCNEKGIEIYFNTVLQPQPYSIRSYDSKKLLSLYNQYSTYNFKTTDKISVENIKHFKDLTHQIKAWYDEKVTMESVQELYNEQVHKYLKKIDQKGEARNCSVKILKLILSLEQHEKLSANEEFPLNNYFFNPEYVKIFQKQPQEHFSLLAEEFGNRQFFLSYLEILRFLGEERMVSDELAIFHNTIKDLYGLSEDPLLKRIVKGMAMLLPAELMRFFVKNSGSEIKNKILALYRPEDELMDFTEKTIKELLEGVFTRIRIFFEKSDEYSEPEKAVKIKRYKEILNNVFEKLPVEFAGVKLEKQIFLPPPVEMMKPLDNLSVENLSELLIRFAKKEA